MTCHSVADPSTNDPELRGEVVCWLEGLCKIKEEEEEQEKGEGAKVMLEPDQKSVRMYQRIWHSTGLQQTSNLRDSMSSEWNMKDPYSMHETEE